MILFVVLFLTLYGGLNGYLYWTVASGIGQHSWSLAAGLAALVVSPLVLRMLERGRKNWLVTLVAFLGYNWMGVAFLFATVALVIDAVQSLVPSWSNSEALPWLLGTVLALSLYGVVEARKVGVRRLRVQSPKIRDGKPLRVVQISDLHLGHGSSLRQIRRTLDLIRDQQPDLLVSTGDLFDSDLANLEEFVNSLQELNPPLGKIAVTGNHEAYADLEKALELTAESGFQLLRDAAVEPVSAFWVAGVDDPEVLQGRSMDEAEKIALRDKPKDAFGILLKHRPEINPDTVDQFDLQLSGHTHGGQIFPFLFLTRLQYRHPHGLSKVAAHSYLFVSRGTGSWGPKIRVLAPPAITVIDLHGGPELRVDECSG